MQLTVDSKPVYVYTAGKPIDPAVPSVLFIHGAANDHSVWSLQSRYFANHGRNALAVDLPGHGRSEGEPLAGIGEIADWIPRVFDAAGLEKAAIAGHSMGSLAALEAAARHPGRVRAIALIGVSVPMPVSEDLLNAAKANDHAAFDMLNIWGHSPAAQIGGHPVPGLWMTGSYVRLLERAKPGVLYADLKACNDYIDGLASGTRVACPALLIVGRRDLMAPPKAAKEIGAAIPNAKTVVIDGCGHSLMTEQPDRVLDALIGFL